MKNKIKLSLKKIAFLIVLAVLNTLLSFSQSTLPAPPADFDSYNASLPHSTSEVVSYYSSTVGVNRQTRVMLPPGYNKDSTYNVLYLLHGIGGDINEWYNQGVADYVFDFLCASGKIAPMIIVLPNGRAMVDDSPGGNMYGADKVAGFANFEIELIKDLVPFIDTNYSIKRDRKARAIAGLSMGGGQALNFGLAHLDTFAWVGGFSSAPNTKPASTLIPDLKDTVKLEGLWISCGTADGLITYSKNTHDFMAQNNIDHYYVVFPGKGHDFTVWRPSFYYFAQMIFGKKLSVDTTAYNSIKESKNNSGVYYDPSNQTIRLLNDNHIKTANIYDMNGRLMIANVSPKNNTINVNGLKSGMYYIVASDGNNEFHVKFLKH